MSPPSPGLEWWDTLITVIRMRGWGGEDFFSSYRAHEVGLSFQVVLPAGLVKEHGMPQTEFLSDEMPAVKPVSD